MGPDTHRLLLTREAHIQPEVAATPLPPADHLAPLAQSHAARPVLLGHRNLFHPGAHGNGGAVDVAPRS